MSGAFITRLAAIGALGLVAGCMTVGPDLEPMTPAGEAAWSAPLAAGLEPAAEVPEQWWEIFADPVLNELVATAREQNPQLEIAALRVLEARARLGLVTGLKYPQTQVAFGDATYVAPSSSDLLEVLGIDNFWQYSLGAMVTWEADFWGRYRRGAEAAQASLDASVAAYDQAVVLLTAQVVSSYAVIRETEEQLRISRENVALQQRSYELTEVLFRNGENSELDMQQARSLLLGTQATIPTLEAALQQARNALSVLLGRPPGDLEPALARGAGLPVVPADIAVGLPADMLRRRPDVRQAELVAMAQNAVVGQATADLYPSFQLSGAISASSGGPAQTSFGDLFSGGAIAYTFGGSLVWPFLNYDRIRNNIRIEDARLQQALLNYRDTVIQAAREAEDALAALVGSREQSRVLAESVYSARRSNDLSTVRFKEGFSDYQRVLDSQQRLFTQEQRFVTSQANTVRNVVALYKALGGGWQDRRSLPELRSDTARAMRERTNWGDLISDEGT
jgi:NodT family efflux transporter outer membrane factor (OMF) lipoprotein